ncbi:hypothetical protein EDD27_10839 [Nonomuraea polychroma]|uniref:Uncharacterized protein n=1 Tax=Nonomuraea polychroma TaxID=46176 RepID=A0A438MPT0_9ACTN|nr:hypothetical protein [Nonomuraea polychroma]RVX47887.1 hypothetical protein EDD27_10839 [Nonomuraea polychroma]
MREHAGVSREELKQSAAVTVAVLLAVGLVAAWNVLIPGVDAWENIVAAVIGSLRLTGPVAAAFAAWVALRKRRALRGRSLTTWRALKAPLAIVLVVLGSFGATVLVLAIKTVLTDQAGRLSLSGLGMGMAGLALYSVIGWVAGWVLPRTFTPPLAGLACYGAFSWLADDRGWADKLAPGTGEPYDLFQGLSGAPFFDQTIWLLGITAALLLGWAALVTRQAMVLACALLAVLAAGMGVSRVLTQAKPAAAEDIAYSCQEWPITVCVHPGMRAGLTELGAAFTQIASRLAGTPAAFTRVEQRPLDDELKPSTGLAPIHVPDLSAGFAEEAAYEYIDSLAAKCPGTVADGYREIVMAWLRGEPLPGGPLPEHQYAASWFSWLSEHQRREWLRMFYSDFQNCGLSSTHFGGGPGRPALASPPVRPAPESTQVYPVYPDPSGTPATSTVPSTLGPGAAMGWTPPQGATQWAPPHTSVQWPPGHASADGGVAAAPGQAATSGGAARGSAAAGGTPVAAGWATPGAPTAGWASSTSQGGVGHGGQGGMAHGGQGSGPQAGQAGGPHAGQGGGGDRHGGEPRGDQGDGQGSGSRAGDGGGNDDHGGGPDGGRAPSGQGGGSIVGQGSGSRGTQGGTQGGGTTVGQGGGSRGVQGDGPQGRAERVVPVHGWQVGGALGGWSRTTSEAGWAPGVSGSGWAPAVVTESEMSPNGWH